ncbi:MAG: hypothetical protein K0Q59_5433 [Paenibacillus sp.]|jgi:YhgE/Pip-like protein|nr:hypothetical protein [Paenibacillus sp.]
MSSLITLFKQKMMWIGLIVILVVVLLLGLAQIGSSSNPVPKRMPVAFVTLDKEAALPNGQTFGVGKMIEQNIAKMNVEGETPALEWVTLTDADSAMKGLDEQKYYAVIVLPQQLSTKVASILSPQPQAASVNVYINQGMNATGANLVGQIVAKMGEGINAGIRTQLLGAMKGQGDQLNTAQAAALAMPIAFQTENVNPVPAHSANGNAPVSFTILAWFCGIVASMIHMFASNKARSASRSGNAMVIVGQAVAGIVYAFVGALSTLLLVKGILGMTIPDAGAFVWNMAIITFCFYLMQSCLLNWLGLPGMPIMILVFFFGSPILALPEQMLPAFTHDWLYSWIPLRFGSAILRDLLYFGEGVNASAPLAILLITGAAALCLSLLSAMVKSYAPKVGASVSRGM